MLFRSLDDPQRGSSGRNTAFVTLSFADKGADSAFMQCTPDYPKQQGIFKRLFAPSQNAAQSITSYSVEAGTGEKIYVKQVATKEQAAQILREYVKTRILPDISDWQDTGIL